MPMFEKGVDKIAKKTGEEAVELVIAAKNGDKEEIVGECADLFYHTLYRNLQMNHSD